MKFTGNDNEINIKTKYTEFLEWKWIKISEISDVAVDFKIDVYKKLQNELRILNLV